jgi:hypothetical protein
MKQQTIFKLLMRHGVRESPMNQNIIYRLRTRSSKLVFQKNNQQLNKYFIDNKKMMRDK